MSIKPCKSWVENKNARCEKRAMWGTNYCWWHYPKKALIFEFFLVILLTLIFNEPLTYLISKIPFLYYVDREKPSVERIVPGIDKISQIEEKIDHFEVFCADKYSGINPAKSNIEIQYKNTNGYNRIEGELNKNGSTLIFKPKKELKYGEYLFVLLVTDKANNENKLTIPFAIRPNDELNVTLKSGNFENSPYKNMFKDFIENKKSLIEFNPPQYIYELSISNKPENIASLKDIFLTVGNTSGRILLSAEELGHHNANGIEILNAMETLDRRSKNRAYSSDTFIHIDTIAQYGSVNFIILASKRPEMLNDNNIQEGLEIWGTYLSEGYGRSERRRIELWMIPQVNLNLQNQIQPMNEQD